MAVISKNYEVITTFGIYTYTVSVDDNGYVSVGNIRRNGAVWTSDYPAEVHASIQQSIIEMSTLNGENPQNFLVATNYLSEIADLGAEAQANARANIGITDFSIGDLTDVDIGAGLENGKILQVVDGVLVQADLAGGGGGGGFTQEQIEDFVGAMFTNGGGITWTYDDLNSQISGSVTIDHLSISGLSDVTIGGGVGGQVLRYDGAGWVNATLSYNDLSDTPNIPVFGTSAVLDAGTGANEVLLLDQANTLPALDGSALTSLGSISTLSDVTLVNPQNGQVLTYTDGTFGLSDVAGGQHFTEEDAQDAVNKLFITNGAVHSGITFTYDDVANTMTAEVTPLALNDLSDVNTANAQNGRVLTYDNGSFVLSDVATSMASLSDVNLAGIQNGQVLKYQNGTFLPDTDENTNLTEEQVEDIVGAMFTSNQAGNALITFSYVDDGGANDGTINATVSLASSDLTDGARVILDNKANQTFTQSVFAVTEAVDDNSAKIATTQYVKNQITSETGTTLQPLNAQLTTLSNLNPADGNFIVGDGNGFVIESGADARSSLGLGTAALLDQGDVLLAGSGLNALSDVTIFGSANKQFLVNNGAGIYENRTISTTDLSNGDKVPLLNVNNELVLAQVLKPNGGINVNGGLFTVDGVTGNTSISGTLNVEGLTTNTDGLTILNENTGNASISLVSDNDNILITSSGGNIYFDNENLWTTGSLSAGSTTLASLSTTSLALADNLPSALVVAEGGTPYLTFVTSDGGEKVVVGKTLEAPDNSVIGDFTFSGNALSTGAGVSFGTENLDTSGNLTINTDKFVVVGANGNTSVGGTLNVSGNTTLSAGADLNNQNVTQVADLELQSISANGNTIDINVEDNQPLALKVAEGANSYIEVDTTDGSEEVRILKPVEVEGTLQLGSGSIQDTTGTIDLGNTSVTTLGDLVVNNLTVNGQQNANNQQNLQVADRVIELNAGFVGANANDLGFILTRGNDPDALVIWDEANNEFAFGTHSGAIDVNTNDFSAVAGFSYADATFNNLSGANITASGNLSVTGTGSILAPAQVANGNQIVTASWVRGLTLSDLSGTTEGVEDIVGAQFSHANHSTGITFSYVDDGGVNDGEVRATLSTLLTSLASQAGNADRLFYTSALNTISETAITLEGRNLLASNDLHAHLNLEIGTDVQAQNARLDDISGMGVAQDNFIVADGANLVLTTPANARTSLGLDQVNARVTLGFGTAVTNDTGDFLATGSGLNDLSNVTITNDPQAGTPLQNQTLVYTANGVFENEQLTSNQLVDGADLIKDTDSIDRLADVDTTNKAEGKILVFNQLGNLVVGDKRLEEEIQDFVGNAINAGTQTDITVTYDDQNNKIDFSIDATIARLAGPTFTGTVQTSQPANIPNGGDAQVATTKYVLDAVSGQVQGNFQPTNDTLTGISALTPVAGSRFLYTTAQDTFSVGAITANAISFLATDTNLTNLNDVTIGGGGLAGETLRYDGAGGWVNSKLAIADISDGLSGNHTFTGNLVFEGNVELDTDGVGVFTAKNPANVPVGGDNQIATTKYVQDEIGGFAQDLGGLTDVTLANLNGGEVLRYNGANWENEVLAYTDLSGTPTIGVDLQAYNATLAGISALQPVAGDRMLYTTAQDTFATTSVGGTGRNLLSSTSPLIARNALGLGSASLNNTGDFLASGSGLNDLSDVTLDGNETTAHFLVHDGVNTFENRTVSTADLSNSALIPLTNAQGDLTLVGELTVDNIASSGGTIDFGTENLTTTGTITATDLVLSGNATTIHTQNLTVEDRVIELNSEIGANANINDLGLFLNRGSLDDALIIWDEGDDAFKLGTHSGANSVNTNDFSAVAGFAYAPLKSGNITVSGTLSTSGQATLNSLSVTGTGTITAPAQIANANEIVTASWVRGLTLADFGGVTEDVEDITGAQFNHANHSTGISFSYVDDGGANDGEIRATLASNLQDVSGLAVDAGNFIVGDGANLTAQTPAQVKATLDLEIGTDIQAQSSALDSISGLVTAGNEILYTTALDTYATSSVTANGLSLIGSTYAQMKGLLDLEVGTDIQAQNSTLQEIANLGALGNEVLLHTNAQGALTTASVSGFALSILDDADAGTVRTTISAQESNATLSGISALQPVGGGSILYTTAQDTFATATITQAGRDLLDDADASAQRTTLGLVIGTNVQAQNASLQSLADLNPQQANLMLVTDGANSYASVTTTAFGRGLLNEADAGSVRATISAQESNALLTSISGLNPLGNNEYIHTDGVGTLTKSTISANGRSLIATDYASMKGLLDLEIGTDVQAQNDTLQEIADLGALGNEVLLHTNAQGALTTASITSAGLALLDDADNTAQRTTLGLGSVATLDTTVNGGVADAGKALVVDGQGKLGALDGSALTSLGSINTLSDVDTTGVNADNDVLVWDTVAGEFTTINLDTQIASESAQALIDGNNTNSGADSISFSYDAQNEIINLALGISTENLTDVSASPDTNKQVLRYTTDGGLNKYVPTVLGTSTDYDVGTSPNEILLLSTPTQNNVNAVADLIVLGRVIETIDYGSVADAFNANNDFATDWHGSGLDDTVVYASEDYGVLVS